MKSVRKIDGKHVELNIIDGIGMCWQCSSPTIPMMDLKSKGTPECYCPKCHLSYVDDESTLLTKDNHRKVEFKEVK